MTSPPTYHGRVYLKNLPKWFTEQDLETWVTSLHLPAPSGSKMFKKQNADLGSAFLHWPKVTRGQIDTYVEHMNEQTLTFKKVQAEVSPATDVPNNVVPNNVAPPTEPPWRSHRKRTFPKATWLKNGGAAHRFLQGEGKKHSPVSWVFHEQWHNGGSKMSLLSRST